MSDPSETATAETPWGLPWNDLLLSLRPTTLEQSRLNSIIALIDDAIDAAGLKPVRFVAGGHYGSGTMTTGSCSLQLYAVFENFDAENYFEVHLKALTDAISDMRPRPASVSQHGFSVTAVIEDVPVSLYACTDLPAGPAQLAKIPTAPSVSSPTDARTVHLETSCSILRASALRTQSLLYKDMVRVAQHWIASTDFMSESDKPSAYLIQLLMLAAVRTAPMMDPCPELYDSIMRKFFALTCTVCSSGTNVIADGTMASTFIWWPFYYDRQIVDWCVANSLLSTGGRGDSCPLVIVDIAAPFLNVARSLSDWSELRRAGREALQNFERRDVIQRLQDRLQSVTEGFRESLSVLEKQVKDLKVIEESPRRWTGMVQFTESHINSDSWCSVMEVTLRTHVWRVNVRKARAEGMGYSTMVDLSLQKMGQSLDRTLDVDVTFRTTTSSLTFDKENDHAFLQKRSEVLRNREYPLQITVIG